MSSKDNWANRDTRVGLVDALMAIGVLKLEEPKPPRLPKGVLASLIIQANERRDPKMSGWGIGAWGASQILSALDAEGYLLVSERIFAFPEQQV